MASNRVQSAILIEAEKVNSRNFGGTLTSVEGCWKSSSILWMHVNGFPTLSGVIVGSWFPASELAVRHFAQEHNLAEVLLRIEKPRERWTRRRGGYNIPLAQVQETVEALASDGFLAILLEPASPYSDLFTLTSVCDVDSGKIDIEVVGSGFDASDALRSDLTPHERFQIAADIAKSAWEKEHIRIERTYLIDAEKYPASVRRRLQKIGARLRNPAFPDEWMDPGLPPLTMEELVQHSTQHLKESRETILLDHADRYDPIPAGLLERFVSHLLRLCRIVAQSEVPWRTFSLAGSFLSEQRLVIWDFFAPGEYDTRTLSKLKT